MSEKIIEMRRTSGGEAGKSLYDKASTLVAQGRYEEAEGFILEGRETEPVNADFANLDGLMQLRKGDCNGAADRFSEAVLMDEGRADLRNNLGTALLEAGRIKEAADAIAGGLSIDGNNANLLKNAATTAIVLGDTDMAVELACRAVMEEPYEAGSHVVLAETLLRSGDSEAAAEALGRIRFLEGTPMKVLLKAVHLYIRMDMLEEAQDVVYTALESDPFNSRLMLLLGKVLEMRDDLDEARHVYVTILSRDQSNVEARNGLGCVLERTGEFIEALEHFMEAHRLSPSNEQIEVNLGIVLDKLDMDDEAERHLTRVMERVPGFSVAFNAMGCFLSRRGRYIEAAAIFNTAIELEPDNERYRRNLGLAREMIASTGLQDSVL
jgi:Flp pilus assembly protein TadD